MNKTHKLQLIKLELKDKQIQKFNTNLDFKLKKIYIYYCWRFWFNQRKRQQMTEEKLII